MTSSTVAISTDSTRAARPRHLTKISIAATAAFAFVAFIVVLGINTRLRTQAPSYQSATIDQLRSDEAFIAKYGVPGDLKTGGIFDGYSSASRSGIFTTVHSFAAEVITPSGPISVAVRAELFLGRWSVKIVPTSSRQAANDLCLRRSWR